MSRIDEALRRAGGSLGDVSRVSSGDVFVSPWGIGREVEPRESAPAPFPARFGRKGEALSVAPRSIAPRFIPKDFVAGWRERLAVSDHADPLLIHQFRRLVATLFQAQGNGPLKTLMITSAAPGDGKTLTAINLALVLSESYGRRVLLVEGDLRKPAICAAAGLQTTSEGLSDVIKASDDRKVGLIPLTELLTLMPAGRPDPDPLSGLTSERIGRLLKQASENFDWVIIDTPPLGAAPDAGLIAPLVDGVLLVVRAGQTSHAIVQHTIETIGPDRILGVVLNAVSPDVVSGYDDYYGHYSNK